MNDFEQCYIKIREREGFLFSDQQVRMLPQVSQRDPNYSKWRMRQKSTSRLLKYLTSHADQHNLILDLGCGNGWFSHKIATQVSCRVEAWDVNQTEIKQAQRVFQLNKLNFEVKNIFDNGINQKFDFIILNSVLQYFQHAPTVIKRLLSLLKPHGEIHVLDSPFYTDLTILDAQKRSLAYFQQAGVSEMANHYFHHNFDDLHIFNPVLLYDPNTVFNKILRNVIHFDSPFLWIKIKS